MTKKIVIFSSHRTLESGGVGTHIRHLIKEISDSKLEYCVLLGTKKKLLFKRGFYNMMDWVFKSRSEKNVCFFMNMVFCLSRELDKVLSKMSDGKSEIVVHCHERPTVMAAALLRRKYAIKIVQTVHAPFSEQYEISHADDLVIQQFTKILEPGLTLEADHLIAVDALQKQIIENKFEQIDLKITEIINSVDTGIEVRGESIIKNRYGIDNYFVVARHLSKKNGVEYAVRAFALLKNNDYSLFIVGEGPERENLEKLIMELSIGDRVYLLGSRPHAETLNIISHAKLSLVPSISVGIYIEAASLTMLESMLLGTPVIASNIGGLKQVLTHMVTGVLVEERDVATLAEEIDNVMSNSVLYDNIVKDARELIFEKYSSEQWFGKISEIYNSVE